MTKPDESVRKIIDEESVRPRRRDQNLYLAAGGSDPLPVARTDLLYLWDDYRSEYLDFAAQANPVGHQHPMVLQAWTDHARYYGQIGPQSHHLLRWPVEYAKQLSDCFTGREDTPRQVLYAEGEREAVRLAVDLACRRTARPHLAVVGTGHNWLSQTWSYNWDFDPADALWDKLGAVLVSPVDDQARVIGRDPARGWILTARENGVPVIYDESVTGFGRLGGMWGQERAGLTADLTVLGGPCGGGFPLGAVIAEPDYFTGLDDADVSPQAGNPIACNAGSVTLDVIGVGVLEYMEDTSVRLDQGLAELVGQFPDHLVGHHAAGLLAGLVFRDQDRADRFSLTCRAHGLYVAPPAGAVVVLAPPLIISTNEVTRGVDLMAATLLSWDDGDPAV